MVDWIKKAKERLCKKVDAYKAEHNSSTVEIPLHDFFVMLESLETVCSEWSGSSEVNEIIYPVYEKYMDINEEV